MTDVNDSARPHQPDHATQPEQAGRPDQRGIGRRNLIGAGLAIGSTPAAVGGAVFAARPAAAAGESLEPTPACDDGDEATPPQIEGPYFTPNSPERTSLAPPGTRGVPLTVQGFVFDVTCEPLGDVLLDFWQADVNGAYDNVGYRFRGHQFSGPDGAFHLGTIVPGLYPGRTRHLHVKVQAPDQPVLTTQLYFPGEPRNNTDPIFDPRLVMIVRDDGAGGREATFDVVLDVAAVGGVDGGTSAGKAG